MIYAGIGARKLPEEMVSLLNDIGEELAEAGWTLRSGAADGADAAFEKGCGLASGIKEIYLPWAGFNGHASPLYDQPPKAFEIAERFHPSWKKLSQPERHFHARNVQQVLGELVFEPVDMVICWTPDGAETETIRKTGGTGQAIRVANGLGIPVFNLQNVNSLTKLIEFVDKEKK